MGVVPSIASTIFSNLPYGGPVGMIWGWVVAAALILTVGLSMVCGTSCRLTSSDSRATSPVPCLPLEDYTTGLIASLLQK